MDFRKSSLVSYWSDAAVIALLCVSVCPQQACAYVDPSAGGFYMQVVYSGWLMSACVVFKLQKRIRGIVGHTLKMIKKS